MYADHEEPIKEMKDLFGNRVLVEQFKRPWDLVRYFALKTGYEEGRVAYKLKGMMTMKDLWHVKSCVDKAMLEGKKTSYQHAFDSCLFVPKETEQIA
jgi:hypothetical protein